MTKHNPLREPNCKPISLSYLRCAGATCACCVCHRPTVHGDVQEALLSGVLAPLLCPILCKRRATERLLVHGHRQVGGDSNSSSRSTALAHHLSLEETRDLPPRCCSNSSYAAAGKALVPGLEGVSLQRHAALVMCAHTRRSWRCRTLRPVLAYGPTGIESRHSACMTSSG